MLRRGLEGVAGGSASDRDGGGTADDGGRAEIPRPHQKVKSKNVSTYSTNNNLIREQRAANVHSFERNHLTYT